MQMELIYLWINQDTNQCFNQMGFNFSPMFNVSFDSIQRKLQVERIDNLNIFRQDNLMNVTAVIGENGTGKTTLLQFLTSLSDTPLGDATPEYETWRAAQNEYEKFVAVYCERNEHENIKIINKTDTGIFADGVEINPCSVADFQAKDFIGKISHIYLSNSEYTKNNNMRSDAIDYITLTNDALKPIFSDFFHRLFNVPSGLIADTPFNALQSIFLGKMTLQNSQMILDLMYQDFVKSSSTNFCGKSIGFISFSIANTLNLISEKTQKINYQTKYALQPFIADFHRKSKEELCKINSQKGISDTLILNLLCELVFAYDFHLVGNGLSITSVYEQCQRYIAEIQEDIQKDYYMWATTEIDKINAIIKEVGIVNNLLPEYDLGRMEHVETKTEGLWDIVNESINSGSWHHRKFCVIVYS